jgi:hypothetical protein
MSYEGAQQQAAAARAAGEYNRQVGEINAQTATQQAAADAARQRDKVRRISGAQEAAISRAGGSLDYAGDVLFDTAVQGELDALNMEYKGAVAANRYRQGGTLAAMEAESSAAAAETRGTGSLISGLAATADRSYDLLKTNPKIS